MPPRWGLNGFGAGDYKDFTPTAFGILTPHPQTGISHACVVLLISVFICVHLWLNCFVLCSPWPAKENFHQHQEQSRARHRQARLR